MLVTEKGSAKLTVKRSRNPKASQTVALYSSGTWHPARMPYQGFTTVNALVLSITGRCQSVPPHSLPAAPLSTVLSFWNQFSTPSNSHSTDNAALRFSALLIIKPLAARDAPPARRHLRGGNTSFSFCLCASGRALCACWAVSDSTLCRRASIFVTASDTTATTPDELVAPGCNRIIHSDDGMEIEGAGSKRSCGMHAAATMSKAIRPHSQLTVKQCANRCAASTISGHCVCNLDGSS